MKLTTSILTAAFLAFMAMPSTAAAYSRNSSALSNNWPGWVGKLDKLYYTYKQRPEMAPKYLPLSLIKTGRFAEMVEEVEATPNVDKTGWPSWIGDLSR